MSLHGRPHLSVSSLLALSLACIGLGGFWAPVSGHAAETLSLELATDRRLYLEGSSSQVLLSARIHAEPAGPAPAVAAQARTPPADGATTAKVGRNIAFVLDRSGSMAGERIEHVRRAVVAAAAALDPHDLVSVVAFGSELESVVEAQPRDSLRDLEAALAGIEPIGGAALYDALSQGAAQVRRHAVPGMASHLILVTDGPPTKGPREPQDFARLVGLFASEGITLTTLGLGEEFDEDSLAGLARIGHGRFFHVPDAGQLPATLVAEVGELRGLVARDVVLTVDFAWNCEAAESHGWWKGECEPRQAIYRLPYLTRGNSLAAFTTTRIISNGWVRPLAGVKLQWVDPLDGAKHELKRDVTIRFDPDSRTVRASGSPAVLLDAVDLTISEGLQAAIEQFDKHDPRRALRALRRARDEAKELNFELENDGLASRIRILDTHLETLANRAPTALDRKTWRAGLGHEFPVPMKAEEER